MSRSLKKGPYINVSLEKKILAMNDSSLCTLLRTWWDTSSVSSLRRVVSVAMPVTRSNPREVN